ncbi:uncharacterized protein LOC134825692 [Bolinopsis microptera]|uniref:uncharacterized protein LOC134825692 n=1 Tax=Bolinopsis microptera TaxID=2820187 RepID=UPI00307A62B3
MEDPEYQSFNRIFNIGDTCFHCCIHFNDTLDTSSSSDIDRITEAFLKEFFTCRVLNEYKVFINDILLNVTILLKNNYKRMPQHCPWDYLLFVSRSESSSSATVQTDCQMPFSETVNCDSLLALKHSNHNAGTPEVYLSDITNNPLTVIEDISDNTDECVIPGNRDNSVDVNSCVGLAKSTETTTIKNNDKHSIQLQIKEVFNQNHQNESKEDSLNSEILPTNAENPALPNSNAITLNAENASSVSESNVAMNAESSALVNKTIITKKTENYAVTETIFPVKTDNYVIPRQDDHEQPAKAPKLIKLSALLASSHHNSFDSDYEFLKEADNWLSNNEINLVTENSQEVSDTAPIQQESVEVESDVVESVEVESAVVDTAEVESVEVESAVVDTAEVESAVVDTAVVDTAEAESAVVDTAEVESAVVDTAEVESAEVEGAVVDTAEVESAVVDTAEVKNAVIEFSVLVESTVIESTEVQKEVIKSEVFQRELVESAEIRRQSARLSDMAERMNSSSDDGHSTQSSKRSLENDCQLHRKKKYRKAKRAWNRKSLRAVKTTQDN